jgi:hypothetical protein
MVSSEVGPDAHPASAHVMIKQVLVPEPIHDFGLEDVIHCGRKEKNGSE